MQMRKTKFFFDQCLLDGPCALRAMAPTTSLNHTCELGMISPILWMRKLRFQGVQCPVQGHVASS